MYQMMSKQNYSIMERLQELYKHNNLSCSLIGDNLLLLDEMFLIYVSSNSEKMSFEEASCIFTMMTEYMQKNGLKQGVIFSYLGYEKGFDFELFHKFNFKIKDKLYLDEIEHYTPYYKELLCHNDIAVSCVRDMFFKNKEKRVSIVQATGTGKSYIIDSILLDFKSKNKLILAPNNRIISQLKETFVSNGHTDSVDFFTYYKLSRMSDEEIMDLSYDIIVLDELHRTGAATWSNSLNLLLAENKNSFVLGVTATPVRQSNDFRNMATILSDKNVFAGLNLFDAMLQDILPIPKYVCAAYDIEDKISDVANVLSQANMPDKMQIVEDIRRFKASWKDVGYMGSIIRKHVTSDMKKFLVFCKNQEHLDELISLVPTWFKKGFPDKSVNTYTITSYDSVKHEEDSLKAFKLSKEEDSIDLLFSINKFNEGVHLSNDDDFLGERSVIDGVIFARATESEIVYYQQLGRAMMATSSKQPLVLDLVNNADIVLESNFEVSLNNAIAHRRNLFKKISKDKNTYLEHVRFNVIDETRDFKRLISCHFSMFEDKFQYMLNMLIRFKDEYGHLMVSKNSREINEKFPGLANWVYYVRHKYSTNCLSGDIVSILNELGFSWSILDDNWNNQYGQLLEYYKEFGTTTIPYGDERYSKLVSWTDRQARLKRKGLLSSEKEDLLNKLGFIWSKKIEVAFDDRVAELKKYKSIYGCCEIKATDEATKKLLDWSQRMRKLYKANKLSKEKISILEEIGFAWNVGDKIWMNTYVILKNHYNEYGTIKIPTSCDYYNKVVIWLAKQLKYVKQGKLSEDKINLLKDIGAIN